MKPKISKMNSDKNRLLTHVLLVRNQELIAQLDAERQEKAGE
jgi:hypothetical protein